MPGALYPQDHPRTTGSHAEHKVYDALKKQLPDTWCAWHSLRLRKQGREGEGDFVIAIPARGFLVLEVKGGQIELRGGHWLQNGEPMKKAPRDQAQGYARLLVEVLKKRGYPLPFGVACAFPDTDFSAGPLSGDLHNAVIGGLQLPYLHEWLTRLVDELLPRPPKPLPDFRAWRHALHTLWGETWVPRVVLRDRLEDASRRRFALDEEQLAILDHAGELARARVEGAAGTGKTVVARELCLRRAAEGQRVLYLCFTEALAAALEQQLRASEHPRERLRAVAVRQYARERVGEEPPPHSADALEFWERISTRALSHLPPPLEAFDCVVVDEAQDLAAADWAMVEALAGDGGLWIFHDPRQAFWKERGLPEPLAAQLPRLKLRRQQRSPLAIARFAEQFLPGAAPGSPEEGWDPAALRLVQGEEAELLPRLDATLGALLHEGAKPEEIAVLSLGGQKRSALQGLDRVGEHVLVRSDAPEAGGAVVADTFLRFKGLERPFVIVAELDGGWGAKFDTRMYIALTRATASVHLLCTPADLDRDPRLQSLLSTPHARGGDPA